MIENLDNIIGLKKGEFYFDWRIVYYAVATEYALYEIRDRVESNQYFVLSELMPCYLSFGT